MERFHGSLLVFRAVCPDGVVLELGFHRLVPGFHDQLRPVDHSLELDFRPKQLKPAVGPLSAELLDLVRGGPHISGDRIKHFGQSHHLKPEDPIVGVDGAVFNVRHEFLCCGCGLRSKSFVKFSSNILESSSSSPTSPHHVRDQSALALEQLHRKLCLLSDFQLALAHIDLLPIRHNSQKLQAPALIFQKTTTPRVSSFLLEALIDEGQYHHILRSNLGLRAFSRIIQKLVGPPL
mmetsp:Transcript_110772/g.253788  ORF Transcript_110772/g.253788 Transcript_110772/m.253788 type:complete len:235 (-) Transcript_110772:1072-1776(-)